MLPFNPRAFDENDNYPNLVHIASSIEPAFFIDGLGTFFVGLAALASVVTVQWQSNFKNPLLNQLLASRYLLSLVALFAVGMITIRPVYLAWDTFKHYEGYLFYQGF
jgi:CHASE2 domain-containing sensor protein